MNDAPLAAAHGTEVERPLRLLHPFGRGERADPKLFDAQEPVIIGVEAQPRMMVGRQPQRLHGQELERQPHLGLVGQYQIDVRAGKFHDQIGIFQVRMGVRAVQDLVLHVQIHVVEDGVEKLLEARAG